MHFPGKPRETASVEKSGQAGVGAGDCMDGVRPYVQAGPGSLVMVTVDLLQAGEIDPVVGTEAL
jgi:hypothetical protein